MEPLDWFDWFDWLETLAATEPFLAAAWAVVSADASPARGVDEREPDGPREHRAYGGADRLVLGGDVVHGKSIETTGHAGNLLVFHDAYRVS